MRTARLVASATARRLGLPEDVLEGIRLAVGEACARAVSRSVASGVGEPVEVEIIDDPGSLVVRVRDHAPAADPDEVERLSLTLVQGLTHEVHFEGPPEQRGSVLRLSWRF